MGKNEHSQSKQIMLRFKENSAVHMRVYDAIQQMNYAEYGSRNQMLIALLDEHLIRNPGGRPVMALPDKEMQELRKGIAGDIKQILGDALSGFGGKLPGSGTSQSPEPPGDAEAGKDSADLQEQAQKEPAGIDNPEMLESLIGSWNQ